MSDLGQSYRVAAVRFERLLPGSLEQVWAHLTDCAKLTAWYGEDGAIEPRPGGAVVLMGGHIRGTVTRWAPHRQLSYTWNVFSPGEPVSAYPESYLAFELEPKDGQVLLTLTHLPILDRFEKQNAMGWHTFLDMLSDAVAGRPIAPRGDYSSRNAALYGVDMANLVR